MSESNRSSSGGIGFFGLLTILFIGLKLTNYIDWSWWWVLSPLWIPLAAAIVLMLLIVFAYGMGLCVKQFLPRKWQEFISKKHR